MDDRRARSLVRDIVFHQSSGSTEDALFALVQVSRRVDRRFGRRPLEWRMDAAAADYRSIRDHVLKAQSDGQADEWAVVEALLPRLLPIVLRPEALTLGRWLARMLAPAPRRAAEAEALVGRPRSHE